MSEEISYDVNQEPIVLSKILLDKLLATTCPSDCIALYTFYYYTAKWQRTNRVKATNTYVRKGLKWGADKLTTTKKVLEEMGLIQSHADRGKDSKIKGWYVQVNFIWTEAAFQNTQNQTVDSPTTGNEDTNALSTNKENALSVNNEKVDSTEVSSIENDKQKETGHVTLTKGQLAKKKALESHEDYKEYMKFMDVMEKPVEQWQAKDFVVLFYCGISNKAPELRELPTWGKDGKLMEQYIHKYGHQKLKDMIIFFFKEHKVVEKELHKELDMSLSTFATDWIRDKIKILVVTIEKKRENLERAVRLKRKSDAEAEERAAEIRRKIQEKKK